jgi:type I restriction enzyme, S subunit
MSFPRYPKYKASGVEWLGDVPEHWDTPPLYLRYEAVLGKMLDEKRLKRTHLLPYVRNVDVQWDRVNVVELPELDIAPDEFDRFRLKRGDLLICEGGEVGRTAIWRGELEQCAFQKAIHRLRPLNDNEHPRFFFHCMSFAASTGVFVAEGNPNTIPHLTGEKLRRYRFPTPPRDEQTLIASFLDRETAKIDGLVGEQRRLIELLKEKRQAVISHAVTKGLNPHAPLKPSGIEWLGEVPEHWEVMRVKHITRSIEQGWSPQCEGFPVESDNEWGVLKVGCVNGGIFNRDENKVLPSDLEPIPALAISCGDLLISRANTRELVGRAAVAEQDYPNLLLCDKLYRLRLKPELGLPMFLSLYLSSNAARGPIELGATGASASMVNIGQSIILELEIAIPPIDEQRSIVAALGRETTKLDALTAEAERAIELLQERRTALISAAVTGKIDVRGLAGTEAS